MQGEAEVALLDAGWLDRQEGCHAYLARSRSLAGQGLHVFEVADLPFLRGEARHPRHEDKEVSYLYKEHVNCICQYFMQQSIKLLRTVVHLRILMRLKEEKTSYESFLLPLAYSLFVPVRNLK